MRFTLDGQGRSGSKTAPTPRPKGTPPRKAAEAAANEQIIAARAQEEAMKHVLPFKQKQRATPAGGRG